MTIYRGPVAIKLPNQDCLVVMDSLNEAFEFIENNCSLPSEVKVFRCTLDSGVLKVTSEEIDWENQYKFEKAHNITLEKFKEVYRRLSQQ